MTADRMRPFSWWFAWGTPVTPLEGTSTPGPPDPGDHGPDAELPLPLWAATLLSASDVVVLRHLLDDMQHTSSIP